MTSPPQEPDKPTAKVLFRIKGDEGSEDVETLWAFDLGRDRYRIDNCPFYAYGVSLADIVLAPFDPDEQFPTFRQVLHKSGNRTLRIILDEPAGPGNATEKILQEITQMGCGYEGATKRYFAINIPSSADLAAVTMFLHVYNIEWEHADPTYEDVFPDVPTDP